MRFALVFLLFAQDDAPLAQNRERIKSKPPLTAAQQAEYSCPTAPAVQGRKSYTIAVIPIEFSDQKLGSTDLAKLVFGEVRDYFSRASSKHFKLEGSVCAVVPLDVQRRRFERKDLEQTVGGIPACDGVAFITAGEMSARGSPLWPHRGVLRAGPRQIDYLLAPEKASAAILAHESLHLLGLADKYDDEKASVADACIMGTGYSIRNPPPPCAECRIKLGWTSPAALDPSVSTAVVLGPDPSFALRIPLTPEGDETLLLEMRKQLLVWHTGGGRTIELLGRFPTESADRLTPLSDPSFRGRSVGARQVWITDIRVEDGKAWFRVGPDAPLTPLEEWHRTHVGKRLGD